MPQVAVVDGRLRTRRRAEGVGELSREVETAAKRRPGLNLRGLNRVQKTRDFLSRARICGTRNAGLSKFVPGGCASTSYFSARRLRVQKSRPLDGC